MAKAIYPGTFDPITKGHLDVIQRSSQLFETVDVIVGHNIKKNTLFTAEERKSMIEECVKDWANVSVSIFEGLTVDYLSQHKAKVIIRGLRAVSDFEYEFQMALMNKKLNPNCETVYLMPKDTFTYLNSSIVREIAEMGGPVSEFVPASVEKYLQQKFPQK